MIGRPRIRQYLAAGLSAGYSPIASAPTSRSRPGSTPQPDAGSGSVLTTTQASLARGRAAVSQGAAICLEATERHPRLLAGDRAYSPKISNSP